MSDQKPISQSIAELATDLNSPIRQCPYVQALLDSRPDLVIAKSDNAKRGLSEWMDNQDVMFALHVSLRTLQTLRSNGTLPYSRINNKIYYRRADIEQLLNDNYSHHSSDEKGGRK